MIWLCVIAIYALCLASGTFLVYTEHYGWAWIPFLLAACVEVKGRRA